MKMQWRQPGYANESSKITERMQRTADHALNKHFHGSAHYFVIFTMGLDMCAKCQKPRSEHPRAKR